MELAGPQLWPTVGGPGREAEAPGAGAPGWDLEAMRMDRAPPLPLQGLCQAAGPHRLCAWQTSAPQTRPNLDATQEVDGAEKLAGMRMVSQLEGACPHMDGGVLRHLAFALKQSIQSTALKATRSTQGQCTGHPPEHSSLGSQPGLCLACFPAPRDHTEEES